MSGKERMLSAFQHKEADKIPVYEQAFASDVASEILGRGVYAGGTSLHYEEAKAWIVEAAIPLKAIGIQDISKAQLSLNVIRVNKIERKSAKIYIEDKEIHFC